MNDQHDFRQYREAAAQAGDAVCRAAQGNRILADKPRGRFWVNDSAGRP